MSSIQGLSNHVVLLVEILEFFIKNCGSCYLQLLVVLPYGVWHLRICFTEVLAALQALPYSINTVQQLNSQSFWCLMGT